MQTHHDAVMRTTLDIPEDLHQIVVSLAAQTRNSLSHTASELMRRGLNVQSRQARAPGFAAHAVTGLPVLKTTRLITPEDVKALEDV
jgi:hypothetical protein